MGCAAVIDATAAYSCCLCARGSGVPSPHPFKDVLARFGAQLDASQLKKAQSDSQAWITQHPSSDPRTPVQLRHMPDGALAMNRQPRTIDNSEVFKSLWQQTPYTPPHLRSRDSVR